MISFVPASPGDEGVLARLRQKVWAETYRGIYPDEIIDAFDFPWHEARDLERIRSSDWSVFLITAHGQPVGYLILKISEPPKLLSLYLLKDYQRQGIGTKAFALARTVFAKHGVEAFRCSCQPENESAAAFYRSMGGTVISEDRGHANAMENSVTFEFLSNQKEEPSDENLP